MDEIFKNDIEFASAEEIKALQERLLREDIAYLAANSPYYKRVFASYDINPADIQTIDDLQRLPFTEKKDLQLYNDDFLCCPKERIVDYITTSAHWETLSPSAVPTRTWSVWHSTRRNRLPAPDCVRETSSSS